MWVGASGAKAHVATVDEATIREAAIRVDRDGVKVRPRLGPPVCQHWRLSSGA
jgi:hypothetical protein